MYKNFKWKVLLIVAIVAFSLWKIYPPEKQITLGLDLQGGMHIVMKVDLNKVPEAARKDATDRAVEIIRNRIDELGVKEPSITKQGSDHIVIQLPGITDRKRALEVVGRTAHLEFKEVAFQQDLIYRALKGEIPEGYELKELKEEEGQAGEKLLLKSESLLTGDKLTNAGVSFDQGSFGQPIVTLEFNKEGAQAFADLTGKAVGDFRTDGIPRRIAILLDGSLRSAPQVRERIPNGKAIIQGRFSFQEASDLSLVLRAGALPAPVYLEEERTVGPTLGKDSIDDGIRACVIGLLLVFVGMAVYYMMCGFIADFALILNFIILLAGLSMFHAALTMPGIAGLILSLGMAVDANVLIFERMREELALGKKSRAVVAAGYHKAFSTIFDSNLTTLISAILLFWFGTGPIRGFAVTLSLGLIISMFTSLVVTRVIFDWMTRKKEINIRMLHLVGVPKFNYMKFRGWAYLASGLIIVVGLAVFYMRGTGNFGVDFSGGSLEQVKFKQDVDLGKLRSALGQAGIEGVQIQNFGEAQLHEVIIRTPKIMTDPVDKVLSGLVGAGNYDVLRVESVGPSVGSDLRKKALWASLWALAAISIYVGFRYKLSFGFCAILSLLHDALMTVGLYAISGREMNLTFIAAVLTIVGYSINDTIVTYDRIRENLRLMRKMPFVDLVNLSINQTLGRTIITTGMTLLVVIALFFFGGSVINDFAFALLVGIISGAYSTVFIAVTSVVDFQRLQQKLS
ncbi:MAG: protein translocase subunit SecD [Candidatus Omnitrophica bacterium]|nr:protein translocase subunit SecD [Candidatus Omnitrophota bacterium]